MSGQADDRRAFTPRTPANENPDGVSYRRGFVTRHQVSGWRFLMRRIASGVALHDTRMLVDPLRTQTRAVWVGALVVVTGVAGCFLFSLIRPGGVAGNEAVLADRSTAALYVKVDEQLHPVLNLASARLIVGRPDNPTTVKSAELDRFGRGNLLGIPGAPERMVQNTSRDADWTVCDAASGPARGPTVIAGHLAGGGERAGALPENSAVLAENGGRTWLLWQGRRSPLDLNERAVADALGLGAGPLTPRPIATGLFNAVPESPALRAPSIPGAGEPPRYPLPVDAPVGAVVVAFDTENTVRHYAVLADGLQPIPPVLAAILRNTNSFGLDQPPRLGADEVSRTPVASSIGALDTGVFPNDPVTLVDTAEAPVICAHWAKPEGANVSGLTLLSGAALPLETGTPTVDLVASGTRVVVAPGRGYLVQTVGQEPGSPVAGAQFWVSDTGVRYGIDTTGDTKAVQALGITAPPLPIPWSVLSLYAAGPTLSRDSALTVHDTIQTQSAAMAGENR
ncbi:type VII secretion protein EccB [Mycobacterium sp. 1274761.0]|uniref:type VII secretion protein EccB n=1 Tax=Mycobacterium sp. 1274761.0 TaxID=1834077 RepID=UPI0008005546|nr:type VII secretion protein EccB [Mycobacterium sp. 1274761.0]OBK71947.1 type VII secretion protein EccB [Mycobacterium sp. 1274761.0]